jgi:hypothetical protein
MGRGTFERDKSLRGEVLFRMNMQSAFGEIAALFILNRMRCSLYTLKGGLNRVTGMIKYGHGFIAVVFPAKHKEL